jgi:hypothetical protein
VTVTALGSVGDLRSSRWRGYYQRKIRSYRERFIGDEFTVGEATNADT